MIFGAEKLLPLVEAVDKATGRQPHLSTVIRWCSRGSAGVRLEYKCLGGRKLTSAEAVLRYVEAVTAAQEAKLPPQRMTSRQRSVAANRSAALLAERLANTRQQR